MDLRVSELLVTADTLEAYAEVSIAFTVDSRLRIELIDGGLGGLTMREEPVEPAWVKDYDAAEHPSRWSRWWDLSNWTMFAAFDGERRAGGAIMAWNTRDVRFLRRRIDLAALWDLRVDSEYRGRGIGKVLFERGVEWARSKGCRTMIIETQDINVRACKFYRARSCEIDAVEHSAYRDFPDETQLTWRLAL